MPSAMRYLLFGLLCAAIAGLFLPPWYVVVIAYAVGMILGFVLGLALSELGDWWERRQDK